MTAVGLAANEGVVSKENHYNGISSGVQPIRRNISGIGPVVRILGHKQR